MTTFTPTWGETDAPPTLPLPDPVYGYSRRARVKRAVDALRQFKALVKEFNSAQDDAMETRLLHNVRRAWAERNG